MEQYLSNLVYILAQCGLILYLGFVLLQFLIPLIFIITQPINDYLWERKQRPKIPKTKIYCPNCKEITPHLTSDTHGECYNCHIRHPL